MCREQLFGIWCWVTCYVHYQGRGWIRLVFLTRQFIFTKFHVVTSHETAVFLVTNLYLILCCYFCSKTNKIHHSNKFILFWNDTLHVSDGLSVHQGFKIVHLSNRYCRLLASKQTAVSVWQIPVAVCTILNSWWWTERPSETCRMSFQNKIMIKWYIGASGWFYYRNNIMTHDHMKGKFFIVVRLSTSTSF